MGLFDGPRDTRTKRQKLEAMANQTASPNEAAIAREKLKAMGPHPIFNKPGRRENPFGVDTDSMSHEDFMEWANRAGWKDAKRNYGSHDPAPHKYTASRGDALGCDTCARSKDNKRANHTNVGGDPGMRRGKNASGSSTTFHGPPPPGFHDVGPARDVPSWIKFDRSKGHDHSGPNSCDYGCMDV